MLFFSEIFFKILITTVLLLLSVAFLTVAERKIIASIQRRKGPNVVGFFGIFQALADGLKLFVKEIILPSSANTYLFLGAPIITFFLSMLSWVVMPVGANAVLADLNLGLFFILAMSSLSVYGIIIAGWASNSKYAFLGSLRSAAQIISYEVSISFFLISITIVVGSLNFIQIIKHQQTLWFCFPFCTIVFIFFVASLAETNRHPFDLPEAEAELVSGYNVEYSAMSFALFFLGEYANIIIISLLNTIIFFGGFFLFSLKATWVLSFKILLFIILFVWARAAFPRYRYDQLIRLGWKVFLPLSIGNVFLTAGFLFGFNCLP